MALSDLTSSEAVERALDEFDEIGRETFLTKHGFGKADLYYVRRGDRLYDAKAIAGVAYGFQFPEVGSLATDSFSGGEATVNAKLKSSGSSS